MHTKRHEAVQLIPHSRVSWEPGDDAAVAAVVRSGHIAHGAVADAVESKWCERTRVAAAACVGSGTGALRLALHALGVKPGDEVIVPAYSCVALVNAPLALGATPVLADVERDNWTLSADDAVRCAGNRTKAIVAIHMFGLGAELRALSELGIPVIEDCAHGVGGEADGAPFGGGGTAAISSFYATKLVGAGEGGIVGSRDADLVDRVRSARDNGDLPPSGRHLNDHFTDLGAVLALRQLDRLDRTLKTRALLADRYDELIEPLVQQGLVVPPSRADGRVWYRYVVRLTLHDAEEVCRHAATHGVFIKRPAGIEVPDNPYESRPLENTRLAERSLVSLPLYPGLSDRDQERVVATLSSCLEHVSAAA